MKLYHGTNFSSAERIAAQGIDLSFSQNYLDFGKGFYTTPSREHAVKMAVRKTFNYNRKNRKKEFASILQFDYEEDRENCNIKVFNMHSEEWMRFVLANRMTDRMLEIYSELNHNKDQRYDIVKGEIADGKITFIADRIRKGSEAFENVVMDDLLRDDKRKYGYQISFHTPNALKCIQYQKMKIIKGSYERRLV